MTDSNILAQLISNTLRDKETLEKIQELARPFVLDKIRSELAVLLPSIFTDNIVDNNNIELKNHRPVKENAEKIYYNYFIDDVTLFKGLVPSSEGEVSVGDSLGDDLIEQYDSELKDLFESLTDELHSFQDDEIDYLLDEAKGVIEENALNQWKQLCVVLSKLLTSSTDTFSF